ncbi:MAG: hypothetical protein A2Y10_08410 [Planctomycetes bacterium GWF2_41_51]|nr:MAG: hypothetical protein A2Y10_08410 [Planctomycetes bacterium GWF2_41_51]HBG27059.1 malto-oligosyltrehalose trehalohydrolase [Phycisphaerales bacterium]
MANEQNRSSMTRNYPIGAEIIDDFVDFRVWASSNTNMELIIEQPFSQKIKMTVEEDGYFSASVKKKSEPMLYRFLPENYKSLLPDPVSRFQPQGPKGASQVIDASLFEWSDQDWKGLIAKNQIIYEMHIGVYTPEGTWLAAAEQLEQIADAGITILELMPVCEFIGNFGWGYDGICLFSPYHIYGTPDDFRTFVNKAHKLKMGIILDVVYNHIGPESFIEYFSKEYLSSHSGEWGNHYNFDESGSKHVREFFITNACYWVDEFHIDGFRLDATQEIIDKSQVHIIKEIVSKVRQASPEKSLFITGENEPQQRMLIDDYGLDAIWNDDFHHTMHVALTGKNDAYYSDYTGAAQEITSAVKYGFIYQGQFSRWQKKRRGSSTEAIALSKFICYTENHDQIANTAFGTRMHQLISPSKCRCAAALLLLGSWTPLIFQGQEFNCSSPFLYFADVTFPIDKYRWEFLKQFPVIKTEKIASIMPHPAESDTFLKCKLKLNERHNNNFYTMFKELVKLRKNDPVFSSLDLYHIESAILNDNTFILRFLKENEGRLLIFNFGKSLFCSPVANQIFAPYRNKKWEIVFNSEEPAYGGYGIAEIEFIEGWRLPAECAIVLKSV